MPAQSVDKVSTSNKQLCQLDDDSNTNQTT